MKSEPLVTIYVPCRNYGRYLQQAVESIFSQVYSNWELIIIDEGSTDNTVSIAEKLVGKSPSRVSLIKNSKPMGLQKLANHHRKQLTYPIIGLTGSNGKTTTNELIYNVLSSNYKVKATKGNLNNHIGVPLTLLSFTEDLDFGIVEMGANHQKEIHFLCKFNIIILN